MGNMMMSMRTAAAESFDFDESADADFDFVSIDRSICTPAEMVAVVPADLSLSSSSDCSSNVIVKPRTPVTPFAWLSWAISSLKSSITQTTQAKAVDTAQDQEQQQLKTPTSKPQVPFKVQTPAVETSLSLNNDGDAHQPPVVQSATPLKLTNAKANLESVVPDTASECSGSEQQPVCDIINFNASATMAAMVDNFLRSSTSSGSTGSHATAVDEGDRVCMAGFSSAYASSGKVNAFLCSCGATDKQVAQAN